MVTPKANFTLHQFTSVDSMLFVKIWLETLKVFIVNNQSVDAFVIALSSPLYLLSSDSPGTILFTTIFNDTGYGSWCRGMVLGLSCKNKLEMINGIMPKPSSADPFFSNLG